MSILYWPLLLVAAYLLGSVPFAQILARLHGIDLRTTGTGNVGASNLTHQTNGWWGITAGLLDALKGFLPVWIAREANLGLGAAAIAGLAAVVGHNWSAWIKGRSGRGLATAAGLLLALDPPLLVWVGGWALAGRKFGGGIGGFLGWGLLPIVSVAMLRPPTESLALLLVSTVIIGRRMQGNSDAEQGREFALRRAIYDTDLAAGELPQPVEDPLIP